MTHTKPNTEWPVRPIGELLRRVRQPVDVQIRQTYQEIGIRSHCKGIFHKTPTTGEEIGNKRVFWVKPGCLIFNIIFAWEQAVAMTSENEAGMIASHRFPMYTSRNGKLLSEYAWRYFSSPRGKYDLGIASPGGAGRNKTLGQAEFDQLKILVPPLAHQRMAVDTLAAADRAIARTEDLINAKRRLKEGVAEQLLTGRCRMPNFKEEWQVVRADEICEIVIGRTPARKSTSYWATEGIGHPWATISDLRSRWVTDTSEKITDLGIESSNAKLIPRGTTLMSFKLTIGKTARAGIDLYTNEAIAAFFAKDGKVSQEYLCLALPIAVAAAVTDQAIKGATLNKEKVEGILIRLPPLSEQAAISAVMEAAERSIELLEKKQEALLQLKKGLMQKLLPSELRVEAG